MEPHEIKTVIREVLGEYEERGKIDPKTHEKHHEILDRWIAQDDIKKARIESVKTKVVGSAAVAIMGGIFYAIGLAVKEWMKKETG